MSEVGRKPPPFSTAAEELAGCLDANEAIADMWEIVAGRMIGRITPATGAILTLALSFAVSGCAGVLGTDSAQPPQAMAAPPDTKKLAELVRSAFQMAKLSGPGEVSPLRATRAPRGVIG